MLLRLLAWPAPSPNGLYYCRLRDLGQLVGVVDKHET